MLKHVLGIRQISRHNSSLRLDSHSARNEHGQGSSKVPEEHDSPANDLALSDFFSDVGKVEPFEFGSQKSWTIVKLRRLLRKKQCGHENTGGD